MQYILSYSFLLMIFFLPDSIKLKTPGSSSRSASILGSGYFSGCHPLLVISVYLKILQNTHTHTFIITLTRRCTFWCFNLFSSPTTEPILLKKIRVRDFMKFLASEESSNPARPFSYPTRLV